jgi:hypothetical protein
MQHGQFALLRISKARQVMGCKGRLHLYSKSWTAFNWNVKVPNCTMQIHFVYSLEHILIILLLISVVCLKLILKIRSQARSTKITPEDRVDRTLRVLLRAVDTLTVECTHSHWRKLEQRIGGSVPYPSRFPFLPSSPVQKVGAEA